MENLETVQKSEAQCDDSDREIFTKKSKSHVHDMVASIMQLRCDGVLCDVTIRSGDFVIKAHRHILASATEYFKAMFMNDTKEAKTGIVDFSEMLPEVVRQCVEFIYSGEADVSMKIAKDLLDASEMIQLPKLTDLCVEFLAERVNLENCGDVICLSRLYNKESLDEPIRGFLAERFEEFVQTDDFKNLDCDALCYCLKLLKNGSEDRELKKWNGIISWLYHEPEERRRHFLMLLQKIDLSCIRTSFVKKKILSESLVADSVECMKIVLDSLLDDEDINVFSARRSSQLSHVSFFNKGVISACTMSRALNANYPLDVTFDMDVHYHRGNLYLGTGLEIYEYAYSTWTSKDVDFNKVKKNDPCITCFNCHRDHWYRGNWRREEAFKKMDDRLWSSEPAAKELSLELYRSMTCFGCKTSMDKRSSNKSCYNRCIGVGDVVYMITRNYIIEYHISTAAITHHDVSVGLGNGFMVAASAECIYAMGGNRSEDKAIEINLDSKVIKELPNMPSEISYGNAIFAGNKLYVQSLDSGTKQFIAVNFDFAWNRWSWSRSNEFSAMKCICVGRQLAELMLLARLED